MAPTLDDKIAYMGNVAALPRSNGELVFEAPWEGRASGVAVALSEGGAYQGREFRDRLVAEIAADEGAAETGRSGTGEAERGYYERWLASLESLVVGKGLATHEDLQHRAERIAHEDDHDHDHEDHHHHSH